MYCFYLTSKRIRRGFATSELNLFISSHRVLSLCPHSIIMPSENDPSFDYEEEVDRAKQFKDDLGKGG